MILKKEFLEYCISNHIQLSINNSSLELMIFYNVDTYIEITIDEFNNVSIPSQNILFEFKDSTIQDIRCFIKDVEENINDIRGILEWKF